MSLLAAEDLTYTLPDDRAGIPNWKVDEAFPRDVFTFVRVKYSSTRGRGWA